MAKQEDQITEPTYRIQIKAVYPRSSGKPVSRTIETREIPFNTENANRIGRALKIITGEVK
jgi:hypothetical protein